MRPEVPPALAGVVHKCLEKDPSRRFQDASQLASALEPFAPETSRVVADRARKVISANSKTLGMHVSPALAIADASGANAATPQGWSGTSGTGPGGTSRRGMIAVVAAVALAAVVGGFLAAKGLGGSSRAPAAAITPAVVETTSAPPPPGIPEHLAPAIEPVASSTPVASSAPAVAGNAPAASSSASQGKLARPPARGHAGPAPSSKRAAPANTGSDDIPSLR